MQRTLISALLAATLALAVACAAGSKKESSAPAGEDPVRTSQEGADEGVSLDPARPSAPEEGEEDSRLQDDVEEEEGEGEGVDEGDEGDEGDEEAMEDEGDEEAWDEDSDGDEDWD